MEIIKFEDRLKELIDKPTEEKKISAWGGFGKKLYHGELALQLQSQDIINKLITSISIEKINEAEAALAIVKSDLKAHIENRKILTKTLDDVSARLMSPEKNIDAAIKANETALKEAKQQRESQKKKDQDKADELRRVTVQVKSYVNDMHYAILNSLLNTVSNSYKHALEIEIPVENIGAFIEKVKTQRVYADAVTIALPVIKAQFNTQEDIDKCIVENFQPWKPQQYIDGFVVDMEKKFSDWELALKNKPRAIELNEEEKKTTEAAITDQKENQQIAVKLEGLAAPVEESADKPLKKVYQIAAAGTMDEAFKIAAAFLVNRPLTEPALRKITPDNLSIKQMRAALESIKNDDNAFETTGITFKLIEKL